MDLIGYIQNYGIEGLGRYYSTYRGIVTDTDDSDNRGMIQVNVPNIGSDGLNAWARPKSPLIGGLGYGARFLMPHKGEVVLVEFEGGDPMRPLWSYSGWAIGEVPEALANNQVIGLVTPKGNKIYLQEEDGKLVVDLLGSIDVKIGDTTVAIKDDKSIEINGGENEGLINISSLVDKLNKLVSEVNSLKDVLNNHTHPVTIPTPAIAAAIASGVPSPIPISSGTPSQRGSAVTQFNKDDFEDTNITH